MQIVKILPKTQNYAWGDKTFIPNLLGTPASDTPCAELWIGTHKGGEATVPSAEGALLGDFLRAHAQEFYGAAHIERFGLELPFLLKVLAIEKPLSIQLHPTRDQAAAGYAAELPSHATLSRDQWNYKDPQQKAEVLYALTPVTAMCAFRPLQELMENLRELIPYRLPLVFPFLALLTKDGREDMDAEQERALLARFFSTLYQLEKPLLRELITELTDSLAKKAAPRRTTDGSFLTPAGITLKALEEYPEDPGLLAPFFLNVLHLRPGQAVFLEPRTLHAYVAGNGIELMSNSDNVLRGGLTHKKVDVPELLSLLSIKPAVVELCPQVRDSFNRLDILTPTEEFMLSCLTQGSYFIAERKSIELLFCVEGEVILGYEGSQCVLKRGECVVIAASLPAYRATVQGLAFSASIPG